MPDTLYWSATAYDRAHNNANHRLSLRWGSGAPCGFRRDPRVGHQVVVARLALPPGGERHVNASRAVHDPLSWRLDLPSGEMPDLR